MSGHPDGIRASLIAAELATPQARALSWASVADDGVTMTLQANTPVGVRKALIQRALVGGEYGAHGRVLTALGRQVRNKIIEAGL